MQTYFTSLLGLNNILVVMPQFYESATRSVFCVGDFDEESGEVDLIRIPVEYISCNPKKFYKKGKKVNKSKQNLSIHFQNTLEEPPKLEKIQEVPGMDRIENLMGNKYGASISYFKSTFYNFLYSNIKEKADNGDVITPFDCVLIISRKYVDRDIRKWVLEKFIEQDPDNNLEKAKRINSYVNKYIICSWGRDRKEMKELVMGFFYEFILPSLEEKVQYLSVHNDSAFTLESNER